MNTCEKCGHSNPHIGKVDNKSGICLSKGCSCTEVKKEIPRSLKFRLAHFFTQRKLRKQHKTVDERAAKLNYTVTRVKKTDVSSLALDLDKFSTDIDKMFNDVLSSVNNRQLEISKLDESKDELGVSPKEIEGAVKDLKEWLGDGR